MGWNLKASQERTTREWERLSDIEIVDLVRDTALDNIPLNRAYRVQGAHVYIDIPNASALLQSDSNEERCHRRFLRFLHLYQRVVDLVLRSTDLVKVDFQNHRMHAAIYKPYNDARSQVAHAVAVAQLLNTVMAEVNELHEELPNAALCVGIDVGVALAVNNGTRGDREPLFIGTPANGAAKMLSGKRGVYLTDGARAELDPTWRVPEPKNTALSPAQVASCEKIASLPVTANDLLTVWKNDLARTPQKVFAFSRATPPLSQMDLDSLTPANSRQMEMVAIFVDVDNFTNYVAASVALSDEKTAVRLLHVIRKEMRDVLNDFGARKVRYIGDCVHGILAEGTAHTTNAADTVSRAVLFAGAMRDAFAHVLTLAPPAVPLGLAVGLEYGVVSLTGLGVRSRRDRCSTGTTVLLAQTRQEACTGTETAIGDGALGVASAGVKKLFAGGKKLSGLTYNRAMAVMYEEGDPVAKAARPVIEGPTIIVPRAHAI